MKKLRRLFPVLPVVLAFMLIPGCKHGTSVSSTAAPTPVSQTASVPQPALAVQPAVAASTATAAGNSSKAAASGVSFFASSGEVMRVAAPKKPAKVKVTLTVASGKEVHASINETINSKTAQVGDPFTGVLTTPLTTKSGQTAFAEGTMVSGVVVSAQGRGRFAGAGVLAIELKRVGGRPAVATEYVVSKKGKGKRTAALIGGGAGAGVLIGGIAGGGKGALLGGLLGGGAGTAGAAFTGNKQLTISSGDRITFELTQPLSITILRSSSDSTK